jgi:tetratricopeptide (TPR) repeat protein
VLRGQAAIYLAQYTATRDQPALREAARALRRALTLNPRDPRTSLDASGVARVAGDLKLALTHAQRARRDELVSDGPAARAVADLEVAVGRKALEGGDGASAMKAVEAARRAYPGAASAWVLAGDVLLAQRKLDDALHAYQTAKELEPLSHDVDVALAKVHRTRGTFGLLRMAATRVPDHPAADAARWAKLTDAERAAAVETWNAEKAKAEKSRAAWHDFAARELEAALRLDPDGEDADQVRQRLADLGDVDLEARHEAFQDAERHFQQGMDAYRDGKWVDALAAFQEAITRFPDHLPAHVMTAATAWRLLSLPAGTSDEERRLEAHWTDLAFASLQAADALDRPGRLADRHRFRGLLNELLFKRNGSPEARIAAVRAFDRYIDAREAEGAADTPEVEDVRRRRAALEAQGGN